MHDADVSLRAALDAAGREAGRLATLGRELQDSLSELLGTVANGAEVQSLDLLVQQADGLGTYLATLAGTCPAAWRVDAGAVADGLLLGAQRGRLALRSAAEDRPVPSGTCELF